MYYQYNFIYIISSSDPIMAYIPPHRREHFMPLQESPQKPIHPAMIYGSAVYRSLHDAFRSAIDSAPTDLQAEQELRAYEERMVMYNAQLGNMNNS